MDVVFTLAAGSLDFVVDDMERFEALFVGKFTPFTGLPCA
jgi:hypothetical protein